MSSAAVVIGALRVKVTNRINLNKLPCSNPRIISQFNSLIFPHSMRLTKTWPALLVAIYFSFFVSLSNCQVLEPR